MIIVISRNLISSPSSLMPQWQAEIRSLMPELPEAKKRRLIEQYQIPEYDAGILTASRALADFFEQTVAFCQNPKAASNWIMGDLLRDLKEFDKSDRSLYSEASRTLPS